MKKIVCLIFFTTILAACSAESYEENLLKKDGVQVERALLDIVKKEVTYEDISESKKQLIEAFIQKYTFDEDFLELYLVDAQEHFMAETAQNVWSQIKTNDHLLLSEKESIIEEMKTFLKKPEKKAKVSSLASTTVETLGLVLVTEIEEGFVSGLDLVQWKAIDSNYKSHLISGEVYTGSEESKELCPVSHKCLMTYSPELEKGVYQIELYVDGVLLTRWEDLEYK